MEGKDRLSFWVVILFLSFKLEGLNSLWHDRGERETIFKWVIMRTIMYMRIPMPK